MSAAEWIAQRRELLAAATEGPWETDGSEITQHWSLPRPWQTVVSSEVACVNYCYGGVGRGIEHDGDAALIADARTSLPAALDALEAVRALHRGEWACANPRHTSLDLACDACGVVCGCCGEAYLCPTVAAIEAALRGES